MYLKTLECHEPTADAGRFGRTIRAGRAADRPVPEIHYLFAFRPQAAEHLNRYMEEVMRGPSPLSPGWRELIAAWTSARNRCRF